MTLIVLKLLIVVIAAIILALSLYSYGSEAIDAFKKRDIWNTFFSSVQLVMLITVCFMIVIAAFMFL